MENLLYISALIAAIAFTILVIYIAKVLKATQRTMTHVADTLEGLEKQMEGISLETTALLNKTNKLAEDISDKSQRMNTLVDGIKGIGDTVNDFNNSLRSLSNSVTSAANQEDEITTQAMRWGSVLLELWKKRKSGQPKD